MSTSDLRSKVTVATTPEMETTIDCTLNLDPVYSPRPTVYQHPSLIL